MGVCVISVFLFIYKFINKYATYHELQDSFLIHVLLHLSDDVLWVRTVEGDAVSEYMSIQEPELKHAMHEPELKHVMVLTKPATVVDAAASVGTRTKACHSTD